MTEAELNNRLELVCLRITELKEQLTKSPLTAPPELQAEFDALNREMIDLIRTRQSLRVG